MAQEYLKKVQITTQIAAPIEPLFFDDLEGLFKWYKSGDGAPTVEKSDAKARGGDYSLHIKTREADMAIGDFAAATASLPPRQRRYLSFLVHCLPPLLTSNCIVEIIFHAKYSRLEHKASILYNNWDGNIGYTDKNEAPQWFPARATGIADGGIGEIELIVDTAQKEYISIRINQTLIDLKGTPYYTDTTAATLSDIAATIKVETLAAAAQEMYFDDILVRYLD